MLYKHVVLETERGELISFEPSFETELAVVLHTSSLLTRAAPILLRLRPTLHPIGEARVAIVDASMGMANTMHHVHLQVVAALPRARASQVVITAAIGLLVRRPAEVPVGQPLLAVVPFKRVQ